MVASINTLPVSRMNIHQPPEKKTLSYSTTLWKVILIRCIVGFIVNSWHYLIFDWTGSSSARKSYASGNEARQLQ